MYYEKIVRKLNKYKVKYLIVGGLAVNLHGVPRATRDIDIICQMDEKNLVRLIKAIKELGYKPKAPVKLEDFIKKENRQRWRKEKNMLAFSFYNPKGIFEELDIVMQEGIDFESMYKNKKRGKFDKESVLICSLEDLIKMKKKSGRQQDLSDVSALSIIKRIKK